MTKLNSQHKALSKGVATRAYRLLHNANSSSNSSLKFTNREPQFPRKPCHLEDIPNELQYLIVSHFTIKENCLLASCSTYFYTVCAGNIIKSIRKYDSKEQGHDIRTLEHLLRKGNPLEVISISRNSCDTAPNTTPSSAHQLTDTTMSLFKRSNCFALKSLTIRGCDMVSEIGFRKIGDSCSKLIILNLSYLRNLTPSAMQSIIVSNPLIRCLYLERSYNAVNDTVCHALATSCIHLRTLSLSYCVKITDCGLEYLADGCHMLRDLNLAHCTELTSYGICRLLQANPLLKVLSLEWCVNVTDQVIYTIADRCKQLEALGVEHCSMLSDQALSIIPSSLTKLTFLSVDSCGFVGNMACWALANHLAIIKDLYLNNCVYIDDTSMDIVSSYCHNLIHLGIEECSITDISVKYLATRCPQIVTLGLNGNRPITDDSVIYFMDKIPGIERLYLSQTSITNKAVIAIAEKATCIISLSLVDCDVNYIGLCKLGQREYPCHESMKDIHLSGCLQYARYFYGDSFREVMKMQFVNGQAYFNDVPGPIPNMPLPPAISASFIEDGTDTVIMDDESTENTANMTLHHSESSALLNHCLGGVINLQDVIFPYLDNMKKQCLIFLR